MKKQEPKTSESKVLKCLEPKAKIYSRHQTFKPKVLNDLKPYYLKAKIQNKKKTVRTNPKGRRITTFLILGRWLLTTYDGRKAYVPNPNSERGRNHGIWIKP